jgi:valacyclovir hydrolase
MPFFSHQEHRLFYRTEGRGPLLLILPGNTASSACHERELAHFGQRHRAVSMDFLGTGQSDRLAHWPTDWFQQSAHAAAALIEHLGEEHAIVMGTSGGAIAAHWLAILHPGPVSALIADSEVAVYPPGFWQAAVADRAQRTPGQVSFWTFAHGADWEQVVNADSAMIQGVQTGVDIYGGRLAEITCPVLLTASLADDLLPRDVGEQLCAMARQIPDCRVFLANRGGHPLMWSRPEDFRAACDLFLQRLGAA